MVTYPVDAGFAGAGLAGAELADAKSVEAEPGPSGAAQPLINRAIDTAHAVVAGAVNLANIFTACSSPDCAPRVMRG